MKPKQFSKSLIPKLKNKNWKNWAFYATSVEAKSGLLDFFDLKNSKDTFYKCVLSPDNRYFKNKSVDSLKNCSDRVELNLSAQSTFLYTPK